MKKATLSGLALAFSVVCGTANAENRIVIDIEAGDTLSYTVNGSQEVRIDLSSCAGATALVVDLLPNGEYAFTLKDAWGDVKRVYRASLTDAASGEQTESEEGAAMLDTRTERTISGDEAETLTYSGNGWGAGGSGVTVGYSLEGGAGQTLMMATDSGTVSWTPTLNGRYVFRHAVEGGGSDTAVFVVNGLPGSEGKPWEIGEGVTAYVKEHVVYLQGDGEVDEFAGDAPWAEYEKQGCQLVGAYLPRTVTLPASVAATLPISVAGGAPVPVPPAGAVTSWDALTNAVATVASGAEIAVGADITEAGGELVVPAGKAVTIKLYGKTVSCGSVTVNGALTVGDAEDSVGRIVASDGAKVAKGGSVTLLGGPMRGTFTTLSPGVMLLFK